MSKVWLVTGSSRGLGRALAQAVLQRGDRLVAGARRASDVADLVASAPDRALAVALDVTDADAASAAVQAAIERFGRLDVVVNNAGYGNLGAFEDTPADDFRAQVETNFFGVVNVTRAALPRLREQRAGRIIQVSSLGGRIGTPGLAAYQSAKWAVGGFSEVLAKEAEGFGVKVTVLEPGGMATDWAGSSMRIFPRRPEYEPTVGFLANLFENNPGAATGSDPAKVADVICRLADHPAPPVRLLLGTDAVSFAGQVEAARAATDAEWRKVSESTDFAAPDAPVPLPGAAPVSA